MHYVQIKLLEANAKENFMVHNAIFYFFRTLRIFWYTKTLCEERHNLYGEESKIMKDIWSRFPADVHILRKSSLRYFMEKGQPPLPYFMAYSLPEENDTKRQDDREYFRQMYPQNVKRYLRVITEVLDRMDQKESYLYDEYPDKIRMERLAEIVLRLIPIENTMNRETQRSLVKVLLWDEILIRRNRRNL